MCFNCCSSNNLHNFYKQKKCKICYEYGKKIYKEIIRKVKRWKSKKKTWMYLLNIVACFAVIILHCCTPAFFSYKEGIRWDIANVLQQVFKFAVPCFS